MTRTVVVGGGPAGLAAAYRLTEQLDHSALVIERAATPGGLAAGFRHGDYTLDFGPHRLHLAADPAVLADLRRLLGDDLELQRRRGRIRLDGRDLPYPIGPATLLRLGPRRLAGLGVGALAARFARQPQPPASYEDALQARLGEPLYRLFYAPYAEKVWGLPGSQIAVDQAERRVNQRGSTDLLRLLLGGGGRHYLYPRGGFGRIPAAYASALAQRPAARLECDATVAGVEWRDGRIEAVTYVQGGRSVRVPTDHLVWTAPLAELVRRLDPPPPSPVRRTAEELRYRAVVLCYVVLDVPRVGMADTHYFPEQRYPFNRVIEQKNFSAEMVPPDRTVLGMDLTCDPDGGLLAASDDELGRLVLPALAAAGLAQPERVIEIFSRGCRHAYPVCHLGYRAALEQTLCWLAELANLWLVGRHGLFLHNNTHHSILMGYRAADAIAAGDDRATWLAALAQFATARVAD
ncbi:MAG: FAD-dependent oxidoreductase [Chloroflexi bacterium]|nr:FAD-dependent oxidoreductase [Chloroflexota bacterium]